MRIKAAAKMGVAGVEMGVAGGHRGWRGSSPSRHLAQSLHVSGACDLARGRWCFSLAVWPRPIHQSGEEKSYPLYEQGVEDIKKRMQ